MERRELARLRHMAREAAAATNTQLKENTDWAKEKEEDSGKSKLPTHACRIILV